MRVLKIALALVLTAAAAGRAEEQVFWLDKAAADAAYTKLKTASDDQRGAAAWVRLGWLELLHRNDAEAALEAFRRGAGKDPKSGDAWEGVQAASLARLRQDIGADAIRALMEAEPDSARTEAMLRIGRVQNGLFAVWTIPQRIAFAEGLLKATKNPHTASALQGWLQSLQETRLRTDEGFQHWLAQGHVARWHGIGYFGEQGAACFDDELPPEREFKPAAAYPAGINPARWTDFEATPGDTDPLGAVRGATGRGTCIYMRAVLSSPEEREAFVKVRATASWKVWLNGVPVGANDLIRNYGRTELWHGVTLSKGPNVLLLKLVAPEQDFMHDLTLHHADGRAMTDVTSGFEGKSPEPKRNGREARGGTPPADALAVLQEKAKDLSGCTLREAMLCGQLYESLGLWEDAAALDRAVFEKLAGAAYVQFFHAQFVQNDPMQPAARRENVARTHMERAAELDGNFAPALIALARAIEQKDSDKALEWLQRVLAANPECPEAHAACARIYGGRGWRAEQTRALEKAAACARGDFDHAAELARFHAGNLNFQKAFAVIGEIKKAHELEAWWEEIELLAQAGRDADQLAALEAYRRRYPKNARCPMDMAAVKTRLGKPEEAEQLLKLAATLDPRNGEIPRRLMEHYLDAGQLDRAKAQLDLILAEPARIGAYDENLRRYLAFLRGEDDDWTKPWDVDTAALVRQAPPTDSFPKTAHSVVLFDQRLVRLTGVDFKWREEDIHRVVKILSKEGGENYGQLFLGQGEWARFRLRELRVFTPDGRVLEMDTVQEEGRWRMPELDRGAILEFRVRRGNGPIGVDQLVFEPERSPLFQRQREPVVWSRYVVTVPKGCGVRVQARNIATPAVTSETDVATTSTWEFRDLPEFEPERNMPPPDQALPNVRFIVGRPSMPAVIESLRGRSMGQPVARDVAAKAAELTAGLDDPEAKARALYKFVVTEIKDGAGSVPSHILIEKEGSPEILFEALLRAAGLRYATAWTRPPSPMYPEFDPETGLPAYGTPLFVVKLPKGDAWVWPQRWNAWGALPNQLYGGEALVVDGTSVVFRSLPSCPPEEKAMATEISIVLDKDGGAAIKGALVLRHGTAAMARAQLEQFLGKDQTKMIIQNIASRFFPGVVVEKYTISDFDVATPSLEIAFEGTSKKFAEKKKDGIVFRGVIPPLNLSAQLLTESTRKYPVRSIWADNLTTWNVLTIELPENERVRLPDSTALATAFGTYNVTYTLEGRTLRVERRLVFNAMDIPPNQYAALGEMLKAIDDAEKRQVTVRLPAADDGGTEGPANK